MDINPTQNPQEIHLNKYFESRFGFQNILLVILVVIVHSVTRRDIQTAIITGVFVLFVLFLGRRMSFIALPQGIVVQNWFRRYQHTWNEIEKAHVVGKGKYLQLRISLKNGTAITPRSIQRIRGDELNESKLSLMGVMYSVNQWVEQSRDGKLVELSDQLFYPAGTSKLIADLDDLFIRVDAIEGSNAQQDDTDSQVDTAIEELNELTAKISELLDKDIQGNRNGVRSVFNRKADILRNFKNVFVFLGAASMLVVVVLFLFTTTTYSTVVAHEGKNPLKLTTEVEFNPGNGYVQHEIFRTNDAPPYTSIGDQLEIRYLRPYPTLVAENSAISLPAIFLVSIFLLALAALSTSIEKSIIRRSQKK
jgi:energy-coupling factor transporter transmembrane protein EcfT